MNTLKIVGKAATYVGAISSIFVIISAISTYRLIQLSYPTAMPPTDYVILSILLSLFPYLFLTVISLAIAYVLRGVDGESLEIEEDEEVPPTPVQPEESNA